MQRFGYIVLTYEFYQEDDQWVGTCRELGTSVCADMREEPMEDLQEAVGVHLNTLEDVGERKRSRWADETERCSGSGTNRIGWRRSKAHKNRCLRPAERDARPT